MRLLDKTELEALMFHYEPSCLSILVPARRAGTAAFQSPIRLKTLLKKAREELVQTGLPTFEVRRRLAAAQEFLSGDYFWQYQGDSFALFIGSSEARIYRMPLSIEEIVVISDHFYLKPLLPLLNEQRIFYILALSQNAVRLFRATHFDIQSIAVVGAPASLSDLLSSYYDLNRRARYRDRAPSLGYGAEKRTSEFFGSGSAGPEKKSYLDQYCRLVDQAVQLRLRDETAPLVLAAAEPLEFLYRVANTYRNLLDQGLTGNPDHLSPKELLQQALKIEDLLLDQNRQQALKRYREMAGAGRTASNHKQVLAAVEEGQVDTLFISLRDHLWGVYNPDKNEWEVHEARQRGDEDLLDRAAVNTVLTGGKVFALEREALPNGRPLAATLRFPLSEND
jgi:hypothetical protein